MNDLCPSPKGHKDPLADSWAEALAKAYQYILSDAWGHDPNKVVKEPTEGDLTPMSRSGDVKTTKPTAATADLESQREKTQISELPYESL